MILRVLHRTTYRYTDAVTTSHHEARLSPRDTETQRVLSHELTVTPQPSTFRRRFDYFGNRAAHFSFSEPHRVLDVLASSTVECRPMPSIALERTPPWEEVRDRLARDRRTDLLDAYAMAFASPLIPISRELEGYARGSFTPRRPVLEATNDLMGRIRDEFAYDPRATTVATPLDEVLENRRGVCQDFAHVAIGCMRALGLGARYVSGYLVTHPPPGKPKLVGADASHAWFQAFVPETGWIDFDPTNNLMPSEEHVTVAYGRDFADVTPLRGVIHGGGQHELTVAVDVDPVTTAPAPAA